MFFKKQLTFLLLLLLPGCLSMSREEKIQNITSAVSIDKSREESLLSDAFVKGDWPKSAWWEEFQSPALNQLIELALKTNPSLQAVNSRIEAAKQQAKVTRAGLFPSLFFNANDNWRHLSKRSFTHLLNPELSLNGYEVDLSLAFQYEFDFWSKNRNLFRASIGLVKADEAELAQSELILASSLAQSYFALSTNYKIRDLQASLCQIKQEKLDLQKSLVKSALSSNLPPLQDDADLQKARQALIAIEDEISTQKHLINILVGRSPDEDFAITNLQEEPLNPLAIPSNLSLELLSRRPDLMAQIWRVESLAAEVGAAKADFFPSINLAALAGLASISFPNIFRATSQTTGVNPALSLPIFTAGSIRANLRAKKALFDEAVYTYNELVLLSAQEVADLLVHVETAYKQKKMQEKALQDIQDRLTLTLLRQRGGLDSEFSALIFQEEVLLEEIKNLNILYNQYLFTVKLLKALGGGYHEPFYLRDHE